MGFVVTVDEEGFVQFIRVTEERLRQLPAELAKELQAAAAMESANASSRVSSSWVIEGSATEPDVVADVWFAHFLARGTSAHGPVEAERLVFTADGDTVFAQFVSGIGADPFHERAVRDVELRANEILARDLAGVA